MIDPPAESDVFALRGCRKPVENIVNHIKYLARLEEFGTVSPKSGI